MDTGAGWAGVLSMMDIHTKEVFTSDRVPELYPEVPGRVKA
jgi:serine/threonine protein phosphatase 1